MQLLEERRRIKIVPALEEALAMFKNKVDRVGKKIAKVSTKKV
jgi:hypothetical protein